LSKEARDNLIEIKVEPDDEVEPYDGTYACLFCSDSVRGKPALKCWQCNSNPFHRACDKHSRYAEVCPTCGRRTVEVWKGASAGTAAPSAIIDLTGAGDGGEQMPKVAAAARARSLPRQRPAQGLRLMVQQQEGELVLSAAAARSRETRTMAQQRLASAGRAAAEGVGEASLVAAAAHTAAGQRIIRPHRSFAHKPLLLSSILVHNVKACLIFAKTFSYYQS
jgi:hypothetical protein